MAESNPTRFVGLDAHKFYLIAVGVDAQRASCAAWLRHAPH